jgi:hypothetical protein
MGGHRRGKIVALNWHTRRSRHSRAFTTIVATHARTRACVGTPEGIRTHDLRLRRPWLARDKSGHERSGTGTRASNADSSGHERSLAGRDHGTKLAHARWR